MATRQGAEAVFAGAAGALLALLAACAGAPGFEMRFWADDPDAAGAQPGVTAVDAHPCGAVATMRVARIPSFATGAPLGTELIVEYGEEGRERRRWNAPVDYELLAASGDEILIGHYGNNYWIGPGGRLRREGQKRRYPPAAPGRCGPADVHAKSSAYAICGAFTDLASGRRRNLSHEGPCT